MRPRRNLIERVARALATANIPGIIPRGQRDLWVEDNWKLHRGDARIAVREIAVFVEETHKRHVGVPVAKEITQLDVEGAIDAELRRMGAGRNLEA